MATQWSTFPIEFRGGLISNLSPLQHGTNAVGSATTLQNFENNKEGGYSKIKGYTKFSDTEVTGSGNILALKVISSGLAVVARKNTTNYTQYYYGTGTTWTSMATSASTGGGKARHAEFNLDGTDKVVFVDGTNYPAIYSTSGNTVTFLTSSDSADVSGAEHVAIFKNTAFYSKGNNLYFTAPFSVDDFSAANGAGSLSVAQDITGLVVFRDQLIIFTTDTIKRLTGNTAADFQVSPITDRIGCVDADSIQELGGDIIYLAPDGLRLLSATDRIGDLALDIASSTITKDSNTFIDNATSFASVLVRGKSQYRIFSYIAAEQASVAKGLIATKMVSQGASGISWSTTQGIKAFIADSAYSGSQETVMFANNDGYIYKLETGNSFDGSDIEAIYESPFMPITDPQVRKTFYKMVLYTEPTGDMSLDVNLKYDFDVANDTAVIQPNTVSITSTGTAVFQYGASDAKYDTATYGGQLDSVYQENVIGSGKTVALRIEDKSTNPTFTLDTALLEFRQYDRQ